MRQLGIGLATAKLEIGIPCVSPVSFVKRAAVDLEHGVVDFDYVRLEPFVIIFIHALNPERDMHRGCTAIVHTRGQVTLQ